MFGYSLERSLQVLRTYFIDRECGIFSYSSLCSLNETDQEPKDQSVENALY